MIDNKGRLFNKISLIDILLIIIVIGLAVSYGVKSFSETARLMLSTKEDFYIVFTVEGVRDFTINAINVDDVFYEQHAGVVGKVVAINTESNFSTMLIDNGTAVYAPVENRHNINITILCNGNKNDKGYYLNGNRSLTVGSDILIKSNKVITSGLVTHIKDSL